MTDMDPGQLRSAFLSNFNRLKNALEQNGLWADVQKKLHDSGAIEVKVNKHFTNGHRTAFALRIGDSRGKVWACIDGKVIDEDGYDSAQAEEIDIYTKRQIRLCQWNTWPVSFKRDIYGPFGSENLARWAVLRQSNHISYGDSIQPNLQDLTEALRKYRPANFGSRPNPAGLPLPFRQYKFRRTNSQSVSKDNSGAKATGRALNPQQSDELQNEKTPNIADNRASADELSPVNDVNDVNDIEEAMSEDDAAMDLDSLPLHSREQRDKLVARMTKKHIPDALKIAKERQTALYRRIDQAFARSDRQDKLIGELLEMVAGTATGQTGTGDEEDERGEEMPKHSDGHSDNYMGE
ncbi:hypothetical protein HBI26_172470 [Parastagonospora nodorum]|nr:hypothetical protein HBH49_107670 [Parastagonospora nodorum]KAH4089798.1 hypothetical protein HBH46_192020 [Parastagonospora nodorum]KAH4126808.1 hypothetical protein HBH47_045990 [Parastagonospora nodorum]KAH4252323.1 hypothetical protein HBI03_211890 [Parastagonospora nodorum]KAH4259218.1 hypothetical protein HBI04_214210 [Parastagonospora nodorum]